MFLKITQGVGHRAHLGSCFPPANLAFSYITMPGSQEQRNQEKMQNRATEGSERGNLHNVLRGGYVLGTFL